MFATSLALIAQEFEGPRARDRVRHLGRDDRPRRRDRPAGRRRARRRHRLGVDLLRQRADRRALPVDHARRKVRESRDPSQGGVDIPGVVTFSAALFCLVFALIRGNAEGWGSPLIVGLLVASVLLLVAFVVVERRVREPDVRPRRCSASRRSPARRSSPSRCRRRCSRCSSTSRSTCRTCSTTRRSRPGVRFLPLSLLSFFAAAISGRATERACRCATSWPAACCSSPAACC